mmetsp:Transcript_95071/g.255710  ORF Transcript_95071/g.255710 Transcript_95071/m.255710 type:complete len:439 (-) Transcript_95071:152-1468(-)
MPSRQEVVGIELGSACCEAQSSCRTRTPGSDLSRGRGVNLKEGDGLGEHLAVVILGEHRDGLGNGHGLGRAGLGALLHLRIEVVASELQVAQELDILGALVARKCEVFLGIGERLRVAGVLGLHLVELLFAGIDLRGLRGSQGLEVLLRLDLLLLRGAEFALELLKHLIHHTVDARGAPGGARLIDGLVHVDLQEDLGLGRLGGGLGDHAGGEPHGQLVGHRVVVHVQCAEEQRRSGALRAGAVGALRRSLQRQERGRGRAEVALGAGRHDDLVLQGAIAEQHAHGRKQGLVHLQHGLGLLVLREDGDGVTQVGDGLHLVLLLLAELSGLLLTDLGSLLQVRGVLLDLLLGLLDGSGEVAELGSTLLDLCTQLQVLGLRVGNGLGLLLLVGLAPADHLVVHLRLVVRLGVKLGLHLLQEVDDTLHRTHILPRLKITTP